MIQDILKVTAYYFTGKERGDVPSSSGPEELERLRKEYEHRVVRHLNEEFRKRERFGDRVADKMAQFGGSWAFIIVFVASMSAWMIFNIWRGRGAPDPYPFILLNLMLSCIAAIQAPLIMMSQNRASQRSHMEAELDYAVNLKAESEIADMQRDLHRIHSELAEIRHEQQALKELLVQAVRQGFHGDRVPGKATTTQDQPTTVM